MADAKLSAETEVSVPAVDDILYTVDISDTTDGAGGSSRKLTLQRALGQMFPATCQGRLTALTGTPMLAWQPAIIPASTDTGLEVVVFGAMGHGLASGSLVYTDVTVGGLTAGTIYYVNANSATSLSFHTTLANALAASSKVDLTAGITGVIIPIGYQSTNIYFTPDKGNRVCLYDGTRWKMYAFSEVTLALTATTDKNYDVFLYDNSGTLTLELSAAWTNDYTRADALTTQDGVTVKSGATTRRWVGTIRAVATNTVEDSERKRFLYSASNQRPRSLSKYESGFSNWTYSTLVWQQANASTANQFEVICGDPTQLTAELYAKGSNGTGNVGFQVGIGVDSTTLPVGTVARMGAGSAAGEQVSFAVTHSAILPAGYHKITWLECSSATGTTTWNASGYTAGILIQRHGLTGTIHGG